MHTKLLIFHALFALSVADVSHLSREYLPPNAATQRLTSDQQTEPQQQQGKVQSDEVLSGENVYENVPAITDVQQSLDNESDGPSDGESASDPFTQNGFGGFPGRPAFPGTLYPGQGFVTPNIPYLGYQGQLPGLGFPGQGFPGQGFPGQGFPGQGFPGQGLPWQSFPGQGFPGQGLPGQGFPGQGLPGLGFPGLGLPGQGLPGLGFPGQGLPGQGLPGLGFPGQGLTGQGLPGQGLPGQGFPGQGFPPRPGGFSIGGFPGVPYQTSNQQQPGGFNAQPTSGLDVREQSKRVASDTVYGVNGGYIYDKPK